MKSAHDSKSNIWTSFRVQERRPSAIENEDLAPMFWGRVKRSILCLENNIIDGGQATIAKLARNEKPNFSDTLEIARSNERKVNLPVSPS